MTTPTKSNDDQTSNTRLAVHAATMLQTVEEYVKMPLLVCLDCRMLSDPYKDTIIDGCKNEMRIAIANRIEYNKNSFPYYDWSNAFCRCDCRVETEHWIDCDASSEGNCQECCEKGDCTSKDGRSTLAIDIVKGGGIVCKFCKE